MDFEDILFEIADGIARITLNRPERFNAFTTRMYQELQQFLDQIKRDDEIRVAIITGAGKGFCAGSDVSDRLKGHLDDEGEKSRYETLRQLGALALEMEAIDKPVIAAVNGVAVGAGLSIALMADIRIASEKSRFGAVWVKVGLVPDAGATSYLPKIVGRDRALELYLRGEIIDAEEAFRIGLITRLVPHDDLMIETMGLASRIASGPAVAIELTKRGMLRSLDNDLKAQLDYESYAQMVCRNTEDHREGIQAFMDKRKPNFRGR